MSRHGDGTEAGGWTLRPPSGGEVVSLVRMLAGQSPWAELGYDAARCRSLVEPHLDQIMVAVDAAGHPAGFLRWQPHAFLGQAYLHLLAVAPEHRRRGAGRALLRWLEARVFDELGGANLFLCVSAFNAPARAFYAEQDYTEVGVLKDYLRPGMDEVLMRKSRRSLLEPLDSPEGASR